MKKKVGVFTVLLFLFSACGTPAATEPVVQAPRTQTPRPIITLVPSPRPTSTLNAYNREEQNSGGYRFCQVGPEWAQFGSTVNVAVFGMHPNDSVSIYLFPLEESGNTFMTDSNGYVNADIVIPMNAELEWNIVVVHGADVTIECFVWVWSEEYLPTYYAGLTKTPTPTPSSQQIAITATQQILHAKLDKYCSSGQAGGFRFSPNGQWVVAFCKSDSIVIVHTDESKKWDLSSSTLINPYTEYFISVNHWSSDGAYAYISLNPHTDGYWETFHQGVVLNRLNLETGEISEVLPLGKSDWIFYSFGFSPNDRRLAYIRTDRSPVILNIRDMQTGIEQSYQFDPKYNTGGRFVWSPDSEKVVFSIRQFDTNRYEQVATSIVLWEKEKSKTTILLKDHQKNLVAVEWVNDTKIVLQVQYEEDTRFELDLTNNELRQISP